jgi:hypothetical protein
MSMGVLQGLINLNGELVAAFKGEPGDDRIFYSTWKGTGNWSNAARTIPGNTSAGPSLGIYNGSAYAAWKGEYSDPRLFTSKYSGSSWDPKVQIPNAYSDNGAAIAQYGSMLVAAWKSAFDSSLWYATFENGNWSKPAQIGGVGSSAGPSLAAFDNVIYAAWKGAGSDNGIYYTTYDQNGWHSQTPFSNVGTSVGPSLTGVGDKLYAVWKGHGTDETLYYAYFASGTGATKTWSPQNPIPSSGSSVGAAIAPLGSDLYVMAKGKSSDVSLHLANLKGTTWSGWNTDIPGNTGPDSVTLQTAPPGGSQNYTIADVKKDADLTGTTVVLTVVQDIVPANSGAYSTQVNCNSPPQSGTAAPFVWQQYGFRIARNTLFAWVNCYRKEDLPASPLINWDSRVATNGVVSLPGNTLPAGWQLTTTLATDHNNHVTGFSCIATNTAGIAVVNVSETLLGISSSATSANLASIQNFQAVLVAENKNDDGKNDTVKFNSGQAIFLLTANNDVVANAPKGETGEQSNTSYSALPNAYPNGEFYQEIGIGSV